METTKRKEILYDKMSLSESTLAIFIVFGLLLTALAMGLGYFSGNREDIAVPAGIEHSEDKESAVFAEDENRPKPEAETEALREIEE